MYDTILVPTDGSEIATAAGGAAIALGRRFDSTIEVISVLKRNPLDPSLSTDTDSQAQFAADALAEIEAEATESSVDLTTTLVEAEESNSVHQSILGYAASNDIDSILMGTHGRTGVGRVVLGSVAEQTLRESPVPVMTLHENTQFDPAFDSLLVPTDGSDTAEAALDHAIELAGVTDAAVHIVNVVDVGAIAGSYNVGGVSKKLEEASNKALERAVERATDAGVGTVEATVLTGVPDRSICEYAEQEAVDAIVMGTHGRTGVERFLLGSVTERVVRRSTVPVIGTKATAPSDSDTVL